MAGLGVAFAICLALTLRLPPSLEIFRSRWRFFGLVSASSAENVLISSVDWVACGTGVGFKSSFLPMSAPKRV